MEATDKKPADRLILRIVLIGGLSIIGLLILINGVATYVLIKENKARKAKLEQLQKEQKK